MTIHSAARARIVAGLALLILAPLATPAVALERLVFRTPGADEDLREDLISSSLVAEAAQEGVDDPQELLAAAQADYGRLVGVLYAEARFGGIVNILLDGREAADIAPLNTPADISTITVEVQPGTLYRFGTASVAPLVQGTELPEEFAPGEPAYTPAIEDAVDAAAAAWRQVGFAQVDVAEQSIVADHAVERLSAQVRLDPGRRLRFGQLRPEGFSRVRLERIVEIAGLPTGQIYDPDELEQAAGRLRRTGAFGSVTLQAAEVAGPDDRLDFTAIVTEQKPRRFGFGAEISSIDGVTLSGFWLHRNLLGGAERFQVNGELAQLASDTGEDYTIGVALTRPATFGPDVNLRVAAELEQLNEPDFTSQSGTVGFALERIVSEETTLEAGLAYRFSRVTDDAGTRNYSLLSLPIGAVLERRDDPLDPTEGYFVDAELEPFLGFNDADNGGRFTIDARGYRGLGEDDRVVLAGRAFGGSIFGADLQGVPNDFRFYSGGGGTVRGQDYQALGVTLPDGVESGGASLLGLSAEARVGVTDRFGVVAFADWATVGPEATPFSDADSHSGAGLGVRYFTPIGPIRLDVAAPVSGGGSGVGIYVGIGQAF